MSRKTISIEFLKNVANRILADEHPGRAGEREGTIVIIEAALFEAGAYKGFKYLPCGERTDGTVREYL